TANAHGKTTADIGSVWSYNAKNFIIIDVPTANTIMIFSDYSGNPLLPTNYTLGTSFSGTLTHVSSATNTANITFTATVKGQLHPGINNVQVKLTIDGKEITDDGIYYGDNVDLIESYIITDIPSIQTKLKASI